MSLAQFLGGGASKENRWVSCSSPIKNKRECSPRTRSLDFLFSGG